jgi:hypothetical protein
MPLLSKANSHLKWNIFVTPSIPVVTTDFAPGEHERPWPPISSTLIYGSRDTVVVDSFITAEQARAQADWIASTGKKPDDHLCYARTWPSFFRGECAFGTFSESPVCRGAECYSGDEGTNLS